MDKYVDRIISSPYARAVDTIKPFATASGIGIGLDDRLTERILSSVEMKDWMQKLEATYEELDLTYEGGESSNEAMRRGVQVLEEQFDQAGDTTVMVTHGALLSLMLKYYDSRVGFQEWKNLTNPDVYLLRNAQDKVEIEHCWP